VAESGPHPGGDDPRRLTPLERCLRIFTEVRPGEGPTALLMFVTVFLILCSYYFIKPLREGWIAVTDLGSLTKMEVKAYTSFGQGLVLAFVVTWYGRLAMRWPRAKLITAATLFCMSNMLAFWVVQPGLFFTNVWGTGILFYLWVGMFGVFVVAQFWAFCADLYDDEQGRRLIPLVAIGATGGAAAGSGMTDQLLSWGVLTTNGLLVAALVPLAISIVLLRSVDRLGPLGRGRASAQAPEPPPGPEPGPGPERPRGMGAVSLVLRNRFLLAVAAITLLLNWVNTNGENLLFRVLQDVLADRAVEQGVTGEADIREFTREGTTAFYGNFFSWVNVVALLLQAFVASRLLKYGGFGAILLLLPVVALTSYATMALLPVLAVVKMMKIAENSTDYSINNTARHVLWLPVTSELKYKGKPTVDTLSVRVGDGLAALTVLIGVNVLAMSTATYFVVNVALVLFWLALSFVVIRKHRLISEGDPHNEGR